MRRNRSPMDLEVKMTPTLFWIRCPDPLRLAILSPPRGGDRLDGEVRGWRSHAVSTVISLVEPQEELLLGLTGEAHLCERHGIEFISFPMAHRGEPAAYGDTLAHARMIIDRCREGSAVAIHGGSDLGRAALMAACTLVANGVDSQVALDLIAATRGRQAPDTPQQGDWLVDFEDRYRAGRRLAEREGEEPVRLWG